jgi:hypothetical protein
MVLTGSTMPPWTSNIVLLTPENGALSLTEIPWPHSSETVVRTKWNSDGSVFFVYDPDIILIADSSGNVLMDITLDLGGFHTTYLWSEGRDVFLYGFSGTGVVDNWESNLWAMDASKAEVQFELIYQGKDLLDPVSLNPERTKALVARRSSGFDTERHPLELVELKNFTSTVLIEDDFLFATVAHGEGNLLALGDWNGKKILLFDWEDERISILENDAFLIGWDGVNGCFTYLQQEPDNSYFVCKKVRSP